MVRWVTAYSMIRSSVTSAQLISGFPQWVQNRSQRVIQSELENASDGFRQGERLIVAVVRQPLQQICGDADADCDAVQTVGAPAFAAEQQARTGDAHGVTLTVTFGGRSVTSTPGTTSPSGVTSWPFALGWQYALIVSQSGESVVFSRISSVWFA